MKKVEFLILTTCSCLSTALLFEGVCRVVLLVGSLILAAATLICAVRQ